MLNLIKYEFIKKSKLFLILIVTAVLLNAGLGILYGQGGMAAFLAISPLILGIIYLYELIKTYSDDLNKKTGYMLFMTPYSGYTIIASKLITIVLIGTMFLVSYLIFLFVNLSIWAYIQVGDFSLIAEGISQIMEAMNMLIRGTFGISIGDLALMFVTVVVSSIVFVLTVYAAITIRRSIFSNTKFGGVLSFLIFIGINIIIGKLVDLGDKIFNLSYIVTDISTSVSVMYPSAQMFKVFSITIIFNCILSAALMLLSGYLVEKKINL